MTKKEQVYHIRMTENHPSQYQRINKTTLLERGVVNEVTKDEFTALFDYQNKAGLGVIFESVEECEKCDKPKETVKKSEDIKEYPSLHVHDENTFKAVEKTVVEEN